MRGPLLSGIGLGVFPCRGKVPMTAHGLKDAVIDDEGARALFDAHPGWTHVGVAMSAEYMAVDFDTPKCTEEQALQHADLIAKLPVTLTQRTPSGGLHMIYRTSRETRSTAGRLAPHVDTRGLGGYIVTGPGYTIEEDMPVAEAPDWLLDALAPPKREIKRVPAPVVRVGADYGRTALARECARVAGIAEGQRNHELLVSANRIGGLVAGGHVDEGEAIDGLVGAGIAAGLGEREAEDVVRRALEHTRGDPRHPTPKPDPLGGEIYVSTAAEVAAEVEAPRVDVKAEALARDDEARAIMASVVELGGLCEEYTRWVYETADYPQPLLAVASLLALGATIGARRLDVHGGLTTSTLVVAVAPTASGKGRPQGCLIEALSGDWSSSLVGSDLSSTPATIDAIATAADMGHGATWILDEYGPRLKVLLDGRAGGHQRDMRALILATTTTGTGSYRESRSLARGGGVRVIHAPGLTVYGSTTPEALHDAIGGLSVADGLVGRHLWLDALSVLPPRRTGARADMPDSVRGLLGAAAAIHKGWAGGLARTADGVNLYHPIPILAEPDAEALLERYADDVDAKRRTAAGDKSAPLWGRLVEHAWRLSAILSTLARPAGAPCRITVAEARVAMAIAERSCSTIARSIEEHRAETVYEGQILRLRKAIASCASVDGWARLRDVWRHCRAIPSAERERVLQDLVSMGDIEIRDGDRRAQWIRLIR